eukprot:1768826-Rhodomonas_salina.1
MLLCYLIFFLYHRLVVACGERLVGAEERGHEVVAQDDALALPHRAEEPRERGRVALRDVEGELAVLEVEAL